MKKATRRVRNFVRWVFPHIGLPKIPVLLTWRHSVVTTEDGGVGFGAFCYEDADALRIYVAGKYTKTSGVIDTVAHEVGHYQQYMERNGDLSFAGCENDAEERGHQLVEQFKNRRRVSRERG